jgi:hypothetical protein
MPDVDPATEAAIRKMRGLLIKKELIKSGNAGVNRAGQIVDLRKTPEAVPVPPHKWADHILPNVRSEVSPPATGASESTTNRRQGGD